MRPEALLAGAAVAVLVGTAAVAALAPGFLAEPEPGPDSEAPPAHLDVAETTLATAGVTGETATLEVTTFVRHRGGPTDNVTVVVRATDADSGLVVDTNEHEVDAAAEVPEQNADRLVRRAHDDEREHQVPVSVTVPREGSYEVETILYLDGVRVDTASTSISGVEALTPPHAESQVGFHDFPGRPSVEYAVESTGDDRATLSVTSYLTNAGDDPEDDLRLVVTARQADSNVVADRAETTVGTVEAGRTATPEVSVTVPDGYNYYLDATLWRDGVLLESTRSVANLDPQETVAANESRQEVQFEVGDFESHRPESDVSSTPHAEADPDATGSDPDAAEDQPGFGAVAAAVALSLSLAVAARRWSA